MHANQSDTSTGPEEHPLPSIGLSEQASRLCKFVAESSRRKASYPFRLLANQFGINILNEEDDLILVLEVDVGVDFRKCGLYHLASLGI